MIEALRDFVRSRSRLVVLTGAGCSTRSGIGDYRDANGEWKRTAPIQHAEFLQDPATRRRYWARSFHGWPAFAAARPNPCHTALAGLEMLGLITQNVDGLHQAAGQPEVIDLHGRLHYVRCLVCDAVVARGEVQAWLADNNPHLARRQFTAAPDGDADLELGESELRAVRVPECADCGGTLKPDVVFFGDAVPAERVERAYGWLDEADGLLVVGTSLMVFSGFRFCRRAHERGVPIVAINRGRTRADQLLHLKVAGECGAVLQQVLR